MADKVSEGDSPSAGKGKEDYAEQRRTRVFGVLAARQQNADAALDRPDENALRCLDSSFKKNTAFVRRLKTFTEAQLDTAVRDFCALNLTRYVAEMVNSICEAKLKPADVAAVVQLCSLAHQRYADFSTFILDYFKKVFSLSSDNRPTNMGNKFRVDLHLITELLLVGILTEKEAMPIIMDALTLLTRGEKDDKFAHVASVIAFCKQCGQDLLDLTPTRYKDLLDDMDLPKLVSDENRTRVSLKLDEYYDLLCKYTSKLRRDVLKAEQKVNHQLENRGDVNPKYSERLRELKAELEKLRTAFRELTEYLGKSEAQIAVEDQSSAVNSSSCAETSAEMSSEKSTRSLWDSDETRMFYESYPKLEEMLPPILLVKRKGQRQSAVQEKESEAMKALEKEISERAVADSSEDATDSIEPEDHSPVGTESEEKPNTAETFEEENVEDDLEIEKNTNTMLRQEMDAFLVKLPNLINRDMIDEAAIEFVTNLNCKANRKRLLKALIDVHRSRLDLLPFYGRLIAILNPVIDGLGAEMKRLLMGEFRHQLRKTDQATLESKVKVVRYIGELVKFRIFPPDDAVACFRLVLIDLRHHQIDMACHFLESCGYFLLNQSETHLKMKGLLEVMKRRVNSKVHLESRHELLIHNAYYACYPPETSVAIEVVHLTPMQKYVKQLLDQLAVGTLDTVQAQLEKIDWQDDDLVDMLVNWMSQPWNFIFEASQCFACLVGSMLEQHANFGQRVIDNILEQIRLDMEEATTRCNHQRRRACVQMLSELYNYQAVESAVIFNTLYLLITFAESEPFTNTDERILRVCLVCVILETSGMYFCRGVERKQLDVFLVFFQRFWLTVPGSEPLDEAALNRGEVVPMDVITVRQLGLTIRNTIKKLRPRVQFFDSYAAAEEAVQKELEKYKDQVTTSSTVSVTSDEALESDNESIAADSKMVMDGNSMDVCGVDDVGAPSEEEVEEEDMHSITVSSSSSSQTSSLSIADGEESEEQDLEALQFSVELNQLVNDMVQQRICEQPKAPSINFQPPGVDKVQPLLQQNGSETDGSTVKVILMAKGRQSKPVLKAVEIPKESDIARNFQSRAADALREKERMKELTLNMSKRLEEEETEDASATSSKTLSSMEWRKSGGSSKTSSSTSQQQQQQQHRGFPAYRDAYTSRW